MPVRSPQPSQSSRSAFLRGFAGAGLCVIAIGAVAVPVAGIWPGKDDHVAPAPRIANMPDDSGLALIQPAVPATPAHKKHKAARHTWAVQATGTQIVVRPGASVPASESTPVAPDDAVVAKHPAAKKAPKPVGGHEVVTSGGPPETTAAPAATPAPSPAAAASTGLVRLSVQSAGIAASASGDPELQVKLGITGAAATDALPGSVTLHLRPQVPHALSANSDPTLALKADVDMVDATRTTANDPALRMRVRMSIANAPVGTPMVQEPPGGDGKSNVIALTVALANFNTPDHGTPGDPGNPGTGGPGDPTSGPGGPVTPGDPAPTPAPGDPTSGPGGPVTPGDPAPTPAPGDPGTTPAPTDPAPTPAPSDPGTTPPTDPAPTPAPSDPAAAPTPPTEIIIPVGPVRPVGGTTTVPVPPTAADTPVPDVIPIDVTVEQLPPADPAPPSPADAPVAATEVPPAEVPPPPATDPNPDPSTAPDTSTPAASAPDTTAPDTSAPVADATPVSYTGSASG